MEQDFGLYETDEDESSEDSCQKHPTTHVSFCNQPTEWYHGSLSRTVSEQRLKDVGIDGCFLIRESDRFPKNFVLSYLLNADEVLHFRITPVCGEYFVSGYKFDSLLDLVNHFGSHSEICIGRRLTTPVKPPTAVEFSHRKVVASVSFRGMKDTDELSFLKNDIFTVYEDVGQGWLWVKSERNGQSGLVYDGLVEDLSSENLNPDRLPYFHDKISSQEAVQMLMLAGRGSYLVKRSDSFPGNFTLHLNTGRKIEKVLIKRSKKGSYEVGLRNYKCLHDIIERYTQTEICDGFTLSNPLCKPVDVVRKYSDDSTPFFMKTNELPESNNSLDVELYQRLQLNRFSVGKFGPNIKKCGFLDKKSKSEKKWRCMYFVLKDVEGQLFCYENEKQTKAKLVLDLCHCTFYEIHESLFNRCYCFQIILYGMTKPTVFYFAAETNDEFLEWSNCLKPFCAGYRRWHSSPFSSYRKINPNGDDSQKLRKIQHLSVEIHEAKIGNFKNSNDVYGILSLNDAKIYRTVFVATGDNLIFDETVSLENIPSEVSTVSITFYGRAKRLFRQSELGCAKIDLITDKLKDDSFDFHGWVKLRSSKEVDLGQCRICIRFVRQKVMPVEEYGSLYEVLRSNNFELCHSLASICSDDDVHRLATALLNVFSLDNLYLHLLITENNREVDQTDQGVLLFRKTSFASILMNEFLKRTATDYIYQTLKSSVDRILECKTPLETDPAKAEKHADVFGNALQLVEFARHFCQSIVASVNFFPKPLQIVLCSLRNKVCEKWPNDSSVHLRAVSSFVFLRLICLALLYPKRFGLTNENLSEISHRNLLMVTKILQNAANVRERRLNSPADEEDCEPEPVTNFYVEVKHQVSLFLNQISSPCSVQIQSSNQSADIAPHFATIFSVCERYFDKMQNDIVNAKLGFRNLLPVVELLRNHLNHYLKKDCLS